RILVSLWSVGVRLEKVRIADDPGFSDSDFLSAASVTARAQLWPLLRGEFAVAGVDLDEPVIHLIRAASRRWNYATFGSPRTAAHPFGPEVARSEAGIVRVAATNVQPAALLIRRARVTDGTLLVTDRSRTPSPTTRVEHINLTVDDLSLTAPIRFDFDAAV